MQVLEHVEDTTGLFFLGNTYAVNLRTFHKAIEAYDAALALRPDYPVALNNKAVVLLRQEREEEALDHLCKSWERRERLPDGGAALAELFAYLGREPGECR
jgi:tetratricopeptide (TPR) repeat protein